MAGPWAALAAPPLAPCPAEASGAQNTLAPPSLPSPPSPCGRVVGAEPASESQMRWRCFSEISRPDPGDLSHACRGCKRGSLNETARQPGW